MITTQVRTFFLFLLFSYLDLQRHLFSFQFTLGRLQTCYLALQALFLLRKGLLEKKQIGGNKQRLHCDCTDDCCICGKYLNR